MRPQSTIFDMADRFVFDYTLAGWLRKQRDAGCTFDEITNALSARGVHVSRETVRKWALAQQEAGAA